MLVRLSLLPLTLACLAVFGLRAPAQRPADGDIPPNAPAQPMAYPDGQSTPFGNRVAALLLDPGASRAHWGIAVTTLDGTPVYGLDEAKLFRPASTAKLFTTAAAMGLLGTSKQFSTKLYGNLNAANGTIEGDLTLVGGGDPSFGTTDLPYNSKRGQAPAAPDALEAMVQELASEGVRHITGNIVADDRLFATEPAPPGWAAEDLLWGYGALPSALSFGDSELRLVAGHGSVSVEQIVPYMRVINLPAQTGDLRSSPGLTVQADPVRSRDLLVRVGSVASENPPVVEHIAVPEPARYAVEALRYRLKNGGIQVDGEAAVASTDPETQQRFHPILQPPRGCEAGNPTSASCAAVCLPPAGAEQPLLQRTSGPLSEEITFTLKTSANLHAEVLLHDLASGCVGVTARDGIRAEHAWLLQAGLIDHDVLLFDGSGLSTRDLVTPRAEAQLLAYAATQPWFPQWKAALPVGGVDGTLLSRFTEPPLKGHVFAKTGTLGESRALAGYVQGASGRELIFSILEDNHEPGGSGDRTIMDQIVAAIAALN